MTSDRDQPPKPLEPASDHGDYIKAVERVREQVAAEHAKLLDRLPMWVVFGPGTSDHPGLYVARLWVTIPEMEPSLLIRAGTLEQLRDLLPDGLVLIPHQPGEDANIIETWI